MNVEVLYMPSLVFQFIQTIPFRLKTASTQLSTLIKSNHCVQKFHPWNPFFLVSCLSSLKISILLGGKHLDTEVSFPLARRPAVLGWMRGSGEGSVRGTELSFL